MNKYNFLSMNNNPTVYLAFRPVNNKQSDGLSGTFYWIDKTLLLPWVPVVRINDKKELYIDHPAVGKHFLGTLLGANTNRSLIATDGELTERTRKQLEIVSFYSSLNRKALPSYRNDYHTTDILDIVYAPIHDRMGNRKVNGVFYITPHNAMLPVGHRVVKYSQLDQYVELYLPESNQEKAVHLGVWTNTGGVFKPVRLGFVDNFIHKVSVRNLEFALTLHTNFHNTTEGQNK